ncbi:hypothetical protein E4U52_004759, partial [Claviceps spartinae]
TAAPIPIGEVREIPPLPPSGVYDSLDEVMNAIQSWGFENGVAFVKKSTAYPRDLDNSGNSGKKYLM